MCSKRCAKPDFPGSTSLRDPVCTTTKMVTRFGESVGMVTRRSPFGRSCWVYANGNVFTCALSTATAARARRKILQIIPREYHPEIALPRFTERFSFLSSHWRNPLTLVFKRSLRLEYAQVQK